VNDGVSKSFLKCQSDFHLLASIELLAGEFQDRFHDGGNGIHPGGEMEVKLGLLLATALLTGWHEVGHR
jgi:hypothetical protein